MPHLNDDELVLLYYGEPGEPAARDHLAECAECRLSYQKLQRLLNTMDAAPVPERDSGYEKRVWEAVSARAARRAGGSRWHWMGALAAAVIIGIGINHAVRTPNPPKAAPVAAVQKPADEDFQKRVLAAALDSHLESSRVVLTEIVNQDAREAGWMRDTAENLLADNRLYRQTAQASGAAETEALLENLEEVLVEVAHTPGSSPEIRRRILSKGVLSAIQDRTAREGIL